MHKNQFGITRMNLEHLKTFHVVASLGSFTEAAKALYMTQPAVSQQKALSMHFAILFSTEVNVRFA